MHKVVYEDLRMRPYGYTIDPRELKKKWVAEIGIDTIAFAIDDRVHHAKWWRSMGVRCFDVAGHNY